MIGGIRRQYIAVAGALFIIAVMVCAGLLWLRRNSGGPHDQEALDGSGVSPEQVLQNDDVAPKMEEPSQSPDANALVINEDMMNITEDLSVQDVQIDTLEALYLEETHDIQELPPPDGPVVLRAKHTMDDKGTTHKERIVYMEEFAMGMKRARLMVGTTRVEDVNTVTNTATVRESMRTLSESARGMPHPAWDVGALDLEKTYTVSEDNSVQGLQSNWSSEKLSTYHVVTDFEQATVFPQTEMQLNQKYTVNVPTLVQDLPAKWAGEPGKLNVVVSRRVLFDGQEAYQVDVEQTGYISAQISLPVQPIKAKLRGSGKYYVNAETGQILWGEFRYEMNETNYGRIRGTSVLIRGELVPDSSD